MSIIAIKGIPLKCNLTAAGQLFSKSIGGPFDALNFIPKGNQKTFYIRLSETLDPVQVVDRINTRFRTKKGPKYVAYVPEHVPDIPLVKTKKKKNPDDDEKLDPPHEVITKAHIELFNELQFKYPGMYNLSRKTGHKLLDELAMTIANRLIFIMDKHKEARSSCFDLTKSYRKSHPHFGDFQLLLSTLHGLQDATGAPRIQINENELMTFDTQPFMIQKLPGGIVKQVCTNYITKIAAAMNTHIEALDFKVEVGDNEEVIARKKVREEMKKILPYLPIALKQVVLAHFIPEEQPHRRIRIYGEPFLPGREAMAPFTVRYTPAGARALRSRRMYNMLALRVEQTKYAALRAMDASVVSGAKIVIRDADIPLRAVPAAARAALAAHCGCEPGALQTDRDMDISGDEEL